MPIRKLSALLVNQIAAGEVIERPASVVKELLENSLDAGARRVEVFIEEGGAQLIKIIDDGNGIPPDEMPLAIAPHATSKIQTAEDLEAIATLGFRGEALASIASVSRLRLTSRATVDGQTLEQASRLETEGDRISDVRPAGGPPGTTLEIRDLFFNTPARRKFMRTPATEIGHIQDTLLRIAMVNPHVGFRLEHNGRELRDLPPREDHVQRCIDVLGQEMDEGLLPFEHVDPPDRGHARVWGLAGLPQLARATTKFQYVYVNGRSVRDRNLNHAVKEAYRGLIPPDRQPMAVVMLDMDPAEVDVNVHPTKAEVRFRNPNRAHGLVLSSLRQRLLGSDLTPGAAVSPEGSQQNAQVTFAPPPANFSQPEDSNSPEAASAFVDYFKRMDPKQKGFVFQEVRKQLQEEDSPLIDGLADGTDDHVSPQRSAAVPARILQVRNSYVVTEDQDGLLIVDQHALHERVMFQELSQRILGEGKTLESQRLLMPATLSAGERQQRLLDDLQPLFDRIGIEVSPIGPNQLAIHAFPSFLFNRHVQPEEFVSELLDKAEDGRFDTSSQNALEEALHEVIDMMSCKAAVKAGDHLSEDELSGLLARREQVERSSSCPHGRPTSLRLTLKDLEKQFGRT